MIDIVYKTCQLLAATARDGFCRDREISIGSDQASLSETFWKLRVDPMQQQKSASHLTPVFTNAAPCSGHPAKNGEILWPRIRMDAEQCFRSEPTLATFLLASVLNRVSIADVILHRVAQRLRNNVVSAEHIVHAFRLAMEADSSIAKAFHADLEATLLGASFWVRAIEPLLYSKGLHALQAHRLAHWLWSVHRRDLTLFIQSRASEVFQADIHRAARIGRGIFLDRATGLVIGATAVVEDDVSLLQGVMLGGTGKDKNDRHPKVRREVVIGASAKVLGNIEIGAGSRIVAGLVVLQPVPADVTVAGVPAKIVGEAAARDRSDRWRRVHTRPHLGTSSPAT